MPRCDKCGSSWDGEATIQCPICHSPTINILSLIQLKLHDPSTELSVHPFIKVQAILCQKIDEMLYFPFKDLMGKDPHRFGFQKEQYKNLIEGVINTLEKSLIIQIEEALNECCRTHCQFCYQDDQWKFDILGGDCKILIMRKEWKIKDPD